MWKVGSELGGLRFILHLACGQWDRWLDCKSTYFLDILYTGSQGLVKSTGNEYIKDFILVVLQCHIILNV